MGETELVLDSMTVDEALRIVGAKAAANKRGDGASRVASAPVVREQHSRGTAIARPPSERLAHSAS